MVTAVLLRTGVALSLIVAGISYNHGGKPGKAVFGLGVVAAVGLIVLLTTACNALPDSAKSERQIATEAVECLQAGIGGEFAVYLLGGKDAVVEEAVRESTKEQLIQERYKACGEGES